MRILQVTNSFKYAWSSGGVARVAYDLSVGLTKHGHKVTVFSTDKGLSYNKFDKNRAITVDGIETYYFDNLSNALAKTGIAIPLYAALAIREKRKEFDIIHIHEPRRIMNILVYRYAKKYNIPYVFQAHGALPHSKGLTKRILSWLFDCFFTRQFLRDASSVVALTTAEVKQYRAFGVPKEKIEIIPNAISLDEYTQRNNGAFRKKFHIPETQKVVLFLGRINEIKGLDTLIKAFARVTEQISDVTLVIVGPDDGYLGQVRALIASFKIDGNVVISGALYGNDKIEAYFAADIYVLPSRYETFPISLLEAFACSKPAIVSNVESMSDLIVNGETGILVKSQDVDDLSFAIISLLNDESKAKEMGKKGRSYLEENLTIDKIISKVEQLYQKCLVSYVNGV